MSAKTANGFPHADSCAVSINPTACTCGAAHWETGYQAGRASLEAENARLREALANRLHVPPLGSGDCPCEECEEVREVLLHTARAALNPETETP